MKRYPLAPLEDVLTKRHVVGTRRQAAELGVDIRDWYRWRRNGVNEKRADRLAVAAGLTPGMVWDEWEAESVALVDQTEAERRRRRAVKQQRYRQRHPGYVERQREARRAAYEHGREYEKARQRRYYAENAERERARVRAAYWARKAS